MKTISTLTMLATIALIAAAPVCHAGPARAEILPIEDKDLAKLDKEEVKRKRLARQMDEQQSDYNDSNDSSQCGSVEIGNSNNSNKSTNSIVPSNTTVIVTGNVYNTASCGH